MAKHGVQIQGCHRLIQSPQGFHIIGIECEELSKESLRNLSRGQIHAVQSTKQRAQNQSGCFQTRAKVNRNGGRSAMGHEPSMAHFRGGGQSAAISPARCDRENIPTTPGKPYASGLIAPSCRSTTAAVAPIGAALPPRSSAFRLGAGAHAPPVYAHFLPRRCQSHTPAANTRHNACGWHSRCSSESAL